MADTRERPIIFSAPMVRAILDGRKTQTRRVVKPQSAILTDSLARSLGVRPPECADQPVIQCPYGQPGDRLWVRESFKGVASGTIKNGYGEVRYGVAYRADSAVVWRPNPTIIHDLTGFDTGPMQFERRPWKPSIHMPRRASRITLEITGVRVERLQAVSEDDAVAEGVAAETVASYQGASVARPAGFAFRDLWLSINGADSWDSNPWVWVVEFRRLEARDDG